MQAAPDTTTAPSDIEANTGEIWETVDSMIDGFFALLPRLAIAVVVFILFLFIAGWVRRLVRRTTAQHKSANVGKVLGRLVQGVIVLAGLLVALAIVAPSISPDDLLGLLGVGSVAIGFAFRDVLQNYLAGLLILLRQPFSVGDQIVYNDFEGTVEEIETRATILKTYDGRRVLVPNGEIYTNAVTVNTAYDKRRSEYDVGIGYGDDIAKAKQAMKAAMLKVDGVLSDPQPEVLTIDLAGSSVNLRARWWTDTPRAEQIHVFDRVLTALKNALDDAAVDMPYPTNVVLWHDQTEATDGDRTRQREGWPAGDTPPKPQKISGALGKATTDDRPQTTTD